MRLIDADALMSAVMAQDVVDKSVVKRLIIQAPTAFKWHDPDEELPSAQPTVDAVPVKGVEQLKWERDTAIQQLEEHGIPFCGKADAVAVVRCGQCSHSEVCKMDEGDVRYCHIFEMQTEDDYYCADGERIEE